MALGLRNPNNRPKIPFLDYIIGAFDILMLVSVPLTGIIYATMGRQGAVSICSAFGGFAGIGTFLRIWWHLDNFFGGLGFFALAMCGVMMTGVYRSTGIEFLHTFIGGSFIMSVIPFTVSWEKSGEEKRFWNLSLLCCPACDLVHARQPSRDQGRRRRRCRAQ